MIAAAESAGLIGPSTPTASVSAIISQPVEEDGKNLSGGIAKAIAFARVFVRPAAELGMTLLFVLHLNDDSLVILDETTAHVDSNRQHNVRLGILFFSPPKRQQSHIRFFSHAFFPLSRETIKLFCLLHMNCNF